MLYSDNTAVWSTTVDAVDACESCYAVVHTEWEGAEVRKAGCTLERWRYKNLEDTDGHMGAPSLALEQCFRYRSGAPTGLNLQHYPHFQDVQATFVCEAGWSCVSSVPMTGAEPMHMKEMRSAWHAFRLDLGKKSNWGKRFLVLGDNLSVVFAIPKGRCANVPLSLCEARFCRPAFCLQRGFPEASAALS